MMQQPLAQTYICDLAPYVPGLPIGQVARQYGIPQAAISKLASNESPFGPSPRAVHAMHNAVADVHRYPEPHVLTQAIAQHMAVDPSAVVLGNGSNDIIDLIARTYLGAGDEAIHAQYAFAMYAVAVQSVGAANLVVPAKEYGHDLQAMRAAITPRTKVIWLANPNNPTGTLLPYKSIKAWLANVPPHIVVVLDEAYYEYLMPAQQAAAASWLADHPNLIVLRTFSKAYGLAGVRIGYGIAAPAVARALNTVRQPFNANSVGLAGAVAALGDTAFVAQVARHTRQQRQQLLAALTGRGYACMPAHGNFVTFQIADAAKVAQALLRQGIMVRPLANYGLHSWLRVSIGTAANHARFLDALAQAQPGSTPQE